MSNGVATPKITLNKLSLNVNVVEVPTRKAAKGNVKRQIPLIRQGRKAPHDASVEGAWLLLSWLAVKLPMYTVAHI